MRDDDWAEDEAFMEGDDLVEPDGQVVAKAALDLISRFGREAPLRAELAAQHALAVGDIDSYKLFKRVEGAADNLLFLGPKTPLPSDQLR